MVATVQGAETITIPLADIERIEWKDAGLLVNGHMRVFVSDGVNLRSYGPQPNVINPQSLVVHWRRKDRDAFAALRQQVDLLLSAQPARRELAGDPVETPPSGQRDPGLNAQGATTWGTGHEKALRELVTKAKRGKIKLTGFELWGGGGCSVEVAGEAYHRRELAALYKPRGRRPGDDFWTVAALVPEVDNAHDANAVRVDVEGHTVGHPLARTPSATGPSLRGLSWRDELPP